MPDCRSNGGAMTEKTYEKTTSKLVGYEGLLAATFIRAIFDQERLRNGKSESRDCNFDELNRFFNKDCLLYVSEETAERIKSKLMNI